MRTPRLAQMFMARPSRRIAIVEEAVVDVRRDDVEHLLLTGGPVDIVLETGIGASRAGSDMRRDGVALTPLNGHAASDR